MINFHNDNFQNYKKYNVPKAQMILTDIPYNIGKNAYGSNPSWYEGGDNKNGESKLAGKNFFDSDERFKIPELLHYSSRMLKKEPKEKGQAPCMFIFCSFEQQFELIEEGIKAGFPNYINMVFRKDFSAQVLKANMRPVGNCEYAIILYRDKLPKFNNNRKMIFNCLDWPRDKNTEKVHPTQKPVALLEKIIDIFTDIGDVVIDPCAGSGTTLLAAEQRGRKAYGFEKSKKFYNDAQRILSSVQLDMFVMQEQQERTKRRVNE